MCRQPCNILVISRLYQTCWNNLATSLIMSSSLLQIVNSLYQTCCNNMGTSSANTTCWQLVNRFVTTCLQACNNLCVFTRVGFEPTSMIYQAHTSPFMRTVNFHLACSRRGLHVLSKAAIERVIGFYQGAGFYHG